MEMKYKVRVVACNGTKSTRTFESLFRAIIYAHEVMKPEAEKIIIHEMDANDEDTDTFLSVWMKTESGWRCGVD